MLVDALAPGKTMVQRRQHGRRISAYKTKVLSMPVPTDLSLLYLWNFRTLYFVKLFQLDRVSQGASSLLVSLAEEFAIKQDNVGVPILTRCALIPAGVSFSVETFGQNVANLFLDPVGRDFALLKTQMKQRVGEIFYDSALEFSQMEAMKAIYQHVLPAEQAYQLIRNKIFPSAEGIDFQHYTEERIWKIIDYIKNNSACNIRNKELADLVNLSEVQLQRKFKEATGIPIRRYRLWHRLFVTASLCALNVSLSEAAQMAGFTDAPHFNHTFRNMLGMKPSFILRNAESVRIFVGTCDGY